MEIYYPLSPRRGEGLPCVVEKITAQGKGKGEFTEHCKPKTEN